MQEVTVKEYLELLNNCKIYPGMDTSVIVDIGYLDIFPSNDYRYKKSITIQPNDIISVTGKYSNINLPEGLPETETKSTLLTDSILMHAKSSHVDIVNDTIAGLKDWISRGDSPENHASFELLIDKLESYKKTLVDTKGMSR